MIADSQTAEDVFILAVWLFFYEGGAPEKQN
jgi:hypothetical protein